MQVLRRVFARRVHPVLSTAQNASSTATCFPANCTTHTYYTSACLSTQAQAQAQAQAKLSPTQRPSKSDNVLCIHGLFATAMNTLPLVAFLRWQGWEGARPWSFPSRSGTLHAHATKLCKELQQAAAERPGRPIHFVAHSLGGLVLRAALNQGACPEEAKHGRAVLLATPNRGSAWAQWVGRHKSGSMVLGPHVGKQLSSESREYFEKEIGLFPATMAILVVAGNRNVWNPVLHHHGGASDGTVRVEETRLDTPHEHVELPYGHSELQWSRETWQTVDEFLARSNST